MYDATLAAQAQAYADTCPTEHGTAASRDNAGENLFWAASSGPSPPINYTDAVESWYSEISDYLFPTSASGAISNGGVTGHFTQIVWKDTTQVGCGGNTGCTNKFGTGWNNNVVVCRYNPPGNWAGEYYVKVGSLASPPATSPSSPPSPAGSCKSFCPGHAKPWSKKCGWTGCSGCADC